MTYITAAILISTNSDSDLWFIRDYTTLSQAASHNPHQAKFYNISLIYVHAPTEERNDVVTEAFYAKLEKVVLADFNAKVGRKGVFCPTVGQFTLHAMV